MANISIRKLNDDIFKQIKLQAVHNKVSMEEEVRTILKNGIENNENVGDAAIQIFSDSNVEIDNSFQVPKRVVHKPMKFSESS